MNCATPSSTCLPPHRRIATPPPVAPVTAAPPRSALNGNCDLLADDPTLDPDQAEQIQDMQLSCRQMRAVMTDVLDMNKIASGAMTLERLPFSVEDIALKTVRQFRGVAELRKLEIVVFVASNVPAMVLGDPSRVAQCLTNLVSNSCKFVPEETGRVFIYISSAEVLRTVTTDSKFLREPSSSLPSDLGSDPPASMQQQSTPGHFQHTASSGSPLRRPRRHSISASTGSPKLSTLSEREDFHSDVGISTEHGSAESNSMQSATAAKLAKLGALPAIPMVNVQVGKAGGGGSRSGRKQVRRRSLGDYRTISKSQGNLLASAGTRAPIMPTGMGRTHSLVPSWNMARFTSGTGPSPAKASPGEAPAQVQLLFQVVDNGPGLYPHEQKRLFKSFQQARASVARQHGGSGLGLMIVKTLCQSMGGTAAVRSEHGAGSNFWFSINADVQLPAPVRAWRKGRGGAGSVSVPVGSRVGTGVEAIDDSSAVTPSMVPNLVRHASGASSISGDANSAVEQYQGFAAATERLAPYKAYLSVPATPSWDTAGKGTAAHETWAPLQAETADDVARLLGTVASAEAEDDMHGSVMYHTVSKPAVITPEDAAAAAQRNMVPQGVWRRVETIMSRTQHQRRRSSVVDIGGGGKTVTDQSAANAADAAARLVSTSRGHTASGGELSTPRSGAAYAGMVTNGHRAVANDGADSWEGEDLARRSMHPPRGQQGQGVATGERGRAVRLGQERGLAVGDAPSPIGPPSSLPQALDSEPSTSLYLDTGPRASIDAPTTLWAVESSGAAASSGRRSITGGSPHGRALHASGGGSSHAGSTSHRSVVLPSPAAAAISPRRAMDASLMLADINAAGRNVPNTNVDAGLVASIRQSTGYSARSGLSGRRRASDGQASAGAAAAAVLNLASSQSETLPPANSRRSHSVGRTSAGVDSARHGSDSMRQRGGSASRARSNDSAILPPKPTSMLRRDDIKPVTELSGDVMSTRLTPLLLQLCAWRPQLDWPSVAEERSVIVAGLASLRIAIAAGALREEQRSPTSARASGTGGGTSGGAGGGAGGGAFQASLQQRAVTASRYMARCDEEGNASVYIADDDGTQRRMMASTLKRQPGLRENRFGDGLELLEAAMGCLPWLMKDKPTAPTCDLGKKAQVICFDINMSPGMGGVPATRLLRLVEVAYMRRMTPVVAVTANSEVDDRVLYARSGMSALVGKPLDRAHLLMTVERLLRKRSVLIVTDDKQRAQGAAAYIGEQGHSVVGTLDSADILGVALGTIVAAGAAARSKLAALSAKVRAAQGAGQGGVSSVHSMELQESAMQEVWQHCMLLSCRSPWHGTWKEEVARRLAEQTAAAAAAAGTGAAATPAAARTQDTMQRMQSGVSDVSSGNSHRARGSLTPAGGGPSLAAGDVPIYPHGTKAELKRLQEALSLGMLQPWGVDLVLVLTWGDSALPQQCVAKWQEAIPGTAVPFLHLQHAGSLQEATTHRAPQGFDCAQPPVQAARGLLWRLKPGQMLSASLPPSGASGAGMATGDGSRMTHSTSHSQSLSSEDGAGYSAWQSALAEVLSVGPLLGAPSAPVWTPQTHTVSVPTALLPKDR